MEMTKNLQTLLAFAYNHEINIRIEWEWDAGVDVKIGDDMNGYQIESNIEISKLTVWLYQNLKRIYPTLSWE